MAASQATDDADRRWLNCERTLELSRFEAGILAADFSADIAAEAELDEADRRRVDAILREEIERAFERAHAAGGGVQRLWEQLPQARIDFEARIGFLAPAQRARIAGFLDRTFDE
jgi:hypothetical protein